MTTNRNQKRSFFEELIENLGGQLVLPEDQIYDQALALWNGKINKRPVALVRCANDQDVVRTISWARSCGLALSVRGGGHDFAGRALCDGGAVIDFSQMRAVSVNTDARTARVEGGATAADLIGATQKKGLATTTGNDSSVGLAGLTLGGGYGPLIGKCGLVADNLLSAQLVTADARLVTASPTENADLFWALRGGGGNFGAVVSLEYRLYPTTMVLSGLLLFPMDHARAVLRSYDEFIKSTPDELTVLAGFLRTPDGMPVVFLSPVYCGSFEQRERVLAPLRTFAKPLADQIRPLEYAALISSMSAMVPKGRHYCIRTQTLPGLCRETIELLIEQANQLSSPFSVIVLDHFHGAASRVGISETAFSLRQDHLLVEFIAGWEPRYSEEDQKHTQWAQRGSNALAPYALPGGYINLLDQAEEDRVPLAYGSNYARLLSIKKTYDPDDVFHSTIGHISPGSRPASSTTSQSGISELRFPLGT